MPGTSDNQQPESECINTSNNNNNKSNINNNGLDNEVSLVSLPSSSSSSSSHQSSQHQHHGIISSSSSTSSSSSSNVSNCSSSAQKRCDVPSTSKTTVPIDINTCTITTTTATTTTATTTTTNSTEDGESDLSNDKVHHHEKISRENFLSLIRKHRLSYVILNLYSIDEGYSIGLKKFAENDIIETSKLPYEEKELLEFINNEELPPMLSDIFDSFRESHEAPLFYQGSIFMEIRDHCKNVSKKEPYHESSFVRLRPTNQTILSDVNRITSCLSNAKNWTQEEKTILEAKLVLENSEPLRLDPSPIVAIVNNRLQNERKHNKSQKIIESFINRNSQTALKSRAAKFHSLPAPKGLELCDFLMKRKDLPSIAARLNKKIDCVNNKTFQAPAESLDSKLVEIEKFARKLEPVSLKSDSSLIKADEYVMEFQDSEGRASMTCVTIFHRSIDDSYFGQLFLDKKRDFQNKSVDSCLFRLGHKSMVEKYIAQFKDILTENGRKPVKITHRIPNQASKVSNSTVPNLPNHCEKNDLEIREPLYKKPKILQSHPKNGIC